MTLTYERCRFGLVVRHPVYGLGMLEACIPSNQTVNVSFEHGGVNLGAPDLELVGDIFLFENLKWARVYEAEAGKAIAPETLLEDSQLPLPP